MSTLEVKAIQAPSGFDLQMPAGHIIQVVNFRSTTDNTTTTSTTFQDAGVAVTITPSSANSKIWVMVSLNGLHKDGANRSIGTRLVRGSTELSQIDGLAVYTGNSDVSGAGVSMNYLDSPNTTSATEYKIQFRSVTGGQVYINTRYNASHTSHSTITLMEVAG